MKIILSLIILACFGLMGFFYYRFCKKTSNEILNILKNKKWKEVKCNVQTMMNRRKDFIASYLRSQIETLRIVLESIEHENLANSDYIDESLKEVEKNLHRIRRHF